MGSCALTELRQAEAIEAVVDLLLRQPGHHWTPASTLLAG